MANFIHGYQLCEVRIEGPVLNPLCSLKATLARRQCPVEALRAFEFDCTLRALETVPARALKVPEEGHPIRSHESLPWSRAAKIRPSDGGCLDLCQRWADLSRVLPQTFASAGGRGHSV